jgi:MG2 domain
MKSISKVGHRNYLLTAGVSLFIAACLISGKMMLPAPVQPQNFGASTNTGSWLTHIATDKPIYRSGERLYVRAVMLQAIGHLPGALGTATFEIKGPKGDTIASGPAAVNDSVAGYSWDIPPDQAGGEYTVRVSRPMGGDPPAERKFEIRSYRAPRLKSQIVFVRDGYGPGDTVGAGLHVNRAEGGIPSGAKVSVIARVDEVDVWRGETVVDGSGNASVSFKLPSTIARGNGAIAMIVQDGGTVETATKTIPILLQTVDLSLYPEGGDLIAGLTNRVYVEGRTPAKKPADMAGFITDAAGLEVATFRTEHEGRGRFTFVPRKGESYVLRLTEPAGIKATFPLPEVKKTSLSGSRRRKQEHTASLSPSAPENSLSNR